MENEQNEKNEQNIDPNRSLSFTIKHVHAEIMIKAIAKLPYDQVFEFIHDLQNQYQQQIVLAQEPEPMQVPVTTVIHKEVGDEVGEEFGEELACAPAPYSDEAE